MVAFAVDLVNVASENPPGAEYPACVEVITSRLQGLGLPVQRLAYRVGGGRPRDTSGAAVVLSGVGSGRRTLYSRATTTSCR